MKASVVRYYRTENQQYETALMFAGRAYSYAIRPTAPIRVVKLSHDKDLANQELATYNGKPYPVERAVSFYRQLAKAKGITRGADKLLSHAKANVAWDKVEAAAGEDETIEPTEAKSTLARKPRMTVAPKSKVLDGICKDLKLEPSIARRILRKAGMSAPYTDAAKIRKTLKSATK